ncbi:MAG: hypothetical protein ABI772_07780 [Bacteroidota bacterium]
MKRLFSPYIYVSALLLFAGSCKKESTYLYEVEPVTVAQSNGSGKKNIKSTTEFISIAYADVYGTNISSSKLQSLNIVYTAFGDKKLIEDRIIRGFLNSPTAIIPDSVVVNGDTALFITNSYKKIYNREPNAFEKYYAVQLIRNEPYLTPKLIYYALMTSDEYRYY